MPPEDFVRTEILRVVEVTIAGLGVVALLLLWAQLRHTAVTNRLTTYHQYFHDLPSVEKVQNLCRTLNELNITDPLWQAPLTGEAAQKLIEATKDESGAAGIAVRQYLNDFEEFAIAVRSGLVDEDYAYQLEVTRALNAYFGFRELIIHWLAEDRHKAELAGEAAPAEIAYYGELRWLAERWRDRKRAEAKQAADSQEKRSPIKGRL